MQHFVYFPSFVLFYLISFFYLLTLNSFFISSCTLSSHMYRCVNTHCLHINTFFEVLFNAYFMVVFERNKAYRCFLSWVYLNDSHFYRHKYCKIFLSIDERIIAHFLYDPIKYEFFSMKLRENVLLLILLFFLQHKTIMFVFFSQNIVCSDDAFISIDPFMSALNFYFNGTLFERGESNCQSLINDCWWGLRQFEKVNAFFKQLKATRINAIQKNM